MNGVIKMNGEKYEPKRTKPSVRITPWNYFIRSVFGNVEEMGMKNIGKMILALRSHLGISQIDLSDISGISQGYISKLESGLAPDPGLSTIIKLVSAIDKLFNKE